MRKSDSHLIKFVLAQRSHIKVLKTWTCAPGCPQPSPPTFSYSHSHSHRHTSDNSSGSGSKSGSSGPGSKSSSSGSGSKSGSSGSGSKSGSGHSSSSNSYDSDSQSSRDFFVSSSVRENIGLSATSHEDITEEFDELNYNESSQRDFSAASETSPIKLLMIANFIYVIFSIN